MACRKCGSGWTTIHGADRASCPECCKLARCVERKAGRYTDPVQVKACVQCGCEFAATGLAEIAKKACCSAECQKARRASAMRAHQKRYASEAYKAGKCDRGAVLPKRERPRCSMCGQECKSPNCKKYCSRKCFYKARATGVQPWDRSSIDEAARKRPNNVSQSPWRYFHKQCDASMRGFLYEASLLWKRAMPKQASPPVAVAARTFAFFVRHVPKPVTCKLCGVQCVKPAHWKLPHCSWECARKDFTAAVCTCCSRPMKIHFIGGNVEARKAKPVCNRCVLNRHKKMCGDFRKRCRKFDVSYDPKVTRRAVFHRDGFRCHICKKKTLRKYVVRDGRAHPRSPTVDHHPYPLSAGIKGHEWDNVRCACLKCNVRKGASWSGQMLLFR